MMLVDIVTATAAVVMMMVTLLVSLSSSSNTAVAFAFAPTCYPSSPSSSLSSSNINNIIFKNHHRRRRCRYPHSHHSTTTGTTQTTSLASYSIKNAGGGVPVIPPGNRLLFDPSQQGMLGETPALDHRLAAGAAFLPAVVTAPNPASATLTLDAAVPTLQPAQAWLEDIGTPLIPPPFAKASSPVTATVLGRAKLITDDAPGDIEHVILRLPTGFHYVEGQSLSVVPPGVQANNGRPHTPRLYSIASTRYGDLLDGTTVSLCVRRADHYDDATGRLDATKAGVCSTFLCNVRAGDHVQVAGPVGKTLLLPSEYDKSDEGHATDVIMVATGTGIAPFRAFLHRLFLEETVARHQFRGTAWLVLGVPVTGGLLYRSELDAMVANADRPDALEIDYAISREMTNARNGGKLYVQDVLAENSQKLFDRLEAGAHLYVCGLKGMLPGILDTLEQVATHRGMDWTTTLKRYKDNNQWHVEVY